MNFSITYFSSKKHSVLVTEHVHKHGLLAMFVHCYTLIYALSFAHRLKMFRYTPQNGSKAIEEIIKEGDEAFLFCPLSLRSSSVAIETPLEI